MITTKTHWCYEFHIDYPPETCDVCVFYMRTSGNCVVNGRWEKEVKFEPGKPGCESYVFTKKLLELL